MPVAPPDLYSSHVHGQLAHAWIFFWNRYAWCSAPYRWPWPPIPHEPNYTGFAAFQITIRDAWLSDVNQRTWRPYARRVRLNPFHAFQKVNNTRYHQGLPLTLFPPP